MKYVFALLALLTITPAFAGMPVNSVVSLSEGRAEDIAAAEGYISGVRDSWHDSHNYPTARIAWHKCFNRGTWHSTAILAAASNQASVSGTLAFTKWFSLYVDDACPEWMEGFVDFLDNKETST